MKKTRTITVGNRLSQKYLEPAVGREISGLEFSLAPNYPNPFNPSTKIIYTIPETGRVSFTVYDISGRIVSTIVDRVQSRGRYTVEWNGCDKRGIQVAGGIYFGVLRAGKNMQKIKMVLNK